jgi:hypothetical protein
VAASLVGLFGVGLLVAGVFVTDPSLDYPVPTSTQQPHTLHGVIHALAGLVCFMLVALATSALAWNLRRKPGWSIGVALCSVLVIAFFIASAPDTTGAAPNAPAGLFQRFAIVAGWGALASVSWRLGPGTASRDARADLRPTHGGSVVAVGGDPGHGIVRRCYCIRCPRRVTPGRERQQSECELEGSD